MALASLFIPYLPGPGQIWGVRSYSSPSQCPFVRLPPIEVDGSANCPNIHCTTTTPHTYYFDVVESCPEGILQLSIQRFHPNSNPFPNDKRYKIMEAPFALLEHGCQVYIPGYGVAHLLDVAVMDTKRSKEWKVFQCVQGTVVVAEVAARKEWCKSLKKPLGLNKAFFCSFYEF